MNGLNNLDETDREYSLTPTDGLIQFWRSKVKVTAGCRTGKGIHVDAGASMFIFQFGIENIFCIVWSKGF